MSSSLIANWTFMRPTTPSARARASVCRRSSAINFSGEGLRRQQAGRVAGMDAGFLDMLHDAADIDVIPVAQRIDINLDGIVQEAVDENRIISRNDDRVAHVALEIGFMMHNFHRPATEDVWTAGSPPAVPLRRQWRGLLRPVGNAVLGLQKTEVIDQFLETFAVFGQVNCVRAGAENGQCRRPRARRRSSAASGRRAARSRHACGRTATRAGSPR